MEKESAIRQAELFRDYQLECANRLYQLEYENSVSEYTASVFLSKTLMP